MVVCGMKLDGVAAMDCLAEARRGQDGDCRCIVIITDGAKLQVPLQYRGSGVVGFRAMGP